MQQMLQALMNQNGGEGKGGSGGFGGGGGGGGQDGYSVAGNASLQAYGPNRLQFSQSEPTRATGSKLGGNKGTGKSNTVSLPSDSVKTDTFRTPAESVIIPENIPDKYREAVKRYFSNNDPS